MSDRGYNSYSESERVIKIRPMDEILADLYDEDSVNFDEYKYTATYSITYKEAMECLNCLNVFKRPLIQTILYIIIFLCAAVGFFFSFLYQRSNPMWLFWMVATIITGVTIIFYPIFRKRRLAKMNAKSKGKFVTFTKDKIEIDSEFQKWNILLNQTCSFVQTKNLFIVVTPENEVLAIPKRCIDEYNYGLVLDFLIAGTTRERIIYRKKKK